jgi:hypothetical protein
MLPTPSDGSDTAMVVLGVTAGMQGLNGTTSGAFARVAPATEAYAKVIVPPITFEIVPLTTVAAVDPAEVTIVPQR